MPTIQIFDPALCCNTGVCGVDVDQELVRFAADVDWAKQNGAQIERFNLSQQPMAFAGNPAVKGVLEHSGERGLPLALVDGEIKCSGRYPTRDELAAWTSMAPAKSLMTAAIEELVAIGAAVGSNCEPCFKYHYDQAKKFGVTGPDLLHAVKIAQAVKATPDKNMAELTERYLRRKAAPKTIALTAIAVAAPSSKCCPAPAGSDQSAGKRSGCC